jgi:hypothetical protein
MDQPAETVVRLHVIHRGMRREVRLDGGGRLWLNDDAYGSPTTPGVRHRWQDVRRGVSGASTSPRAPRDDFRNNPSFIVQRASV